MNTAPKPKIKISARHLGPVLSLDGELSEKGQNLIFARNGTGKSFLSRGFRCLDQSGDGKDITNAAHNLVSDESPDDKGNLTVSRRGTLGELSLQKNATPIAQSPDKIFHVFSEDFVHEELREKEFNPDSNIENQIAVDSEEIKLKEAQEAVTAAEKEKKEALNALQNKFETAKVLELHQKAKVNRQLRNYRDLSLEDVPPKYPDKPDAPEQSFAGILKDLDSLKSIPAERTNPKPVVAIDINNIGFEAIKESLNEITSPSTVSETIKQEIKAHHAFFETGTKLITEHNADTCPYCKQDIDSSAVSTIESYIKYFQDEEARHKYELRQYKEKLEYKEKEISELLRHIARQRTQFDALKQHIPSQKAEQLANCETEAKQACAVITSFKEAIEEKANAIDQAVNQPSDSINESIQNLAKVVERNNAKVEALRAALERTDSERLSLQRRACAIFASEFSRDHWGEIENIAKLQTALKTRSDELAVQEKANPKKDAKERVAKTFELLLREFFAGKYVFDRDNFILNRGGKEMTRGPHRTLSDGEKTAIAFCYFIACIHRKVKSNGDYKKLFLIFDDPVTSMSYDFIFNIAQTLKNLSISNQGEISIDPSRIDGNKCTRPELIILTHNSYFFNISITNGIVQKESAFSLDADSGTHELSRLNNYVAPFQQQLKDIFEIAEKGKKPDHQTGNTIRSVLEAIGRFCRPDKSNSLTDFINFLAKHDGFNIRSIMINNLSHGTYYEETPTPDDLKLACQETVRVVKKFAPGQLEIIQSD